MGNRERKLRGFPLASGVAKRPWHGSTGKRKIGKRMLQAPTRRREVGERKLQIATRLRKQRNRGNRGREMGYCEIGNAKSETKSARTSQKREIGNQECKQIPKNAKSES